MFAIYMRLFLLSILFVNTKSLPVYPLQDTGNTAGTATLFGEDKDYVINPLSFIDNGDGTITDSVTKLMWEQSESGEIGWDGSVQYCKELSVGGYTDWRLPDIYELYGIVDLGKPLFSTPPFVVPYPPRSGEAQYHWTSTSGREERKYPYKWAINANGGAGDKPIAEAISDGGKESFRAKCVRTAVPFYTVDTRYTVYNLGLVAQDNTNGLMWQLQEPGTMSWRDAISYCEKLVYSGYDDWRLPDLKELFTTVDPSRLEPATNTLVFTQVEPVADYWTSSPIASAKQLSTSWIVQMRAGISTQAAQESVLHVRCVRAGYIAS